MNSGKVVILSARPRLCFRLPLILASLLLVTCLEPVEQEEDFRFAVVNVGEGLAQIGTIKNNCFFWDIGPVDRYRDVYAAYLQLGKPHIDCIFISHSDLDHCGGLAMLDTTISWSGKIAVSKYEDTAYLRTISTHWKTKVSFLIIKKGVKLDNLKNVHVDCLWPPEDSPFASEEDRNFNSLVFTITYGRTRCFISSDIDSSVQNLLILNSVNLQSDIMVAAHHGSGNFSPSFIQYINPMHVVVSCSDSNVYNHPADRLLANLLSFGAFIHFTFSDGTITFRSNTYYWSEN
jgi:competence protein ComEC